MAKEKVIKDIIGNMFDNKCSHGVIGRRVVFKPPFLKEFRFESEWEYARREHSTLHVPV